MKITLLGIVALGLVAVGCSTTNLPKGARLVGGGLKVTYEAPSNGTAILIERTSGRIVATESLHEGSDFEFGPNQWGCSAVIFSMFAATNAQDTGEFAQVPTNTVFELYFVPDPAKKE